ncbi:MAG: TonB-dependent receptor [Chitinispirillales bacterium]|jgi:outer membrane receptor for ferrienterochelin and colicin|nr:TonB-dependent receptor [Chitinispirillales bacterium]
MKYIISLFFTLTICCYISAQHLNGTVYGKSSDGTMTLSGAYIFWEGTQHVTTSDADGNFAIDIPQTGKRLLIASFVGYQNDTIEVSNGVNKVEFELIEGFLLGEAVVSSRRRGNFQSRITPIQTEVITAAGLQKMACCNLAESFENSASVTVGFTDAVSGAKQIQMLGLSGIYTQMLDENIPTLRGLSSTFGWNYIPGPWLESIQVSKGTSSVVNGYESTTGQINLEYKKPDNTETLFLNLFGADDGRMEANITSATKVSENLWTGLMLHGSTEPSEHDANHDGFLDMPKTKLFNIYNRWIYNNQEKEISSRFDFKYLYDTRDGGQIAEIANYQTHIENNNLSLSNKTGFAFGSKEEQSIGIINSFKRHEINSVYGAKEYSGVQNSYYSNVLVSSYMVNTSHKYTVGGSFMYDKYDEHYTDLLPIHNPIPHPPYPLPVTPIPLLREEIVSGVFAQYTYSYLEKMIVIIGLRGDWHNRYGFLFTPRTNIKYNFTDNIIFRASAGRGFRSPSVICENIGYLASSRELNVASIKDLTIEKAWNYGANLTFYIPMPDDRTFSISMDYYRTDFDNQAIIDMEYDRSRIYFYNLHGKSYANACQIDVNTTPFKGFDIYAAFRLSDTKITYSENGQNITVDKPLLNKYRGLVNLSYATNFEKWKFDITAQFNGKSRLPSDGYNGDNEWSPAYLMYFAQISKKTKRLDVYAGCENIWNYKQKDPIIGADDPFGTNFDASRIWGPLMGRKFYVGIRLRIGEIK